VRVLVPLLAVIPFESGGPFAAGWRCLAKLSELWFDKTPAYLRYWLILHRNFTSGGSSVPIWFLDEQPTLLP
jgi:hypothetical protein